MADLKRANSPQDESAVADLRRSWSTIPKTVSGSLAHAHESSTGRSLLVYRWRVDAGEALAQGEDLVTASPARGTYGYCPGIGEAVGVGVAGCSDVGLDG